MSPSTLQFLRSLAWLRWHIVINTLTRSGARDLMERLSRTAESVLPLAILVMLLPVAVVLLVLGGWTGTGLADDPGLAVWPLQITRWALLIMFVITMLSPVILSTGQQAAGMIRLLLLPIPVRVLYLAHAAGGLADPWAFLTVPLLVGVTAGLAWKGMFASALASALAGIGFVIALLGVAALASAILQLLVRNRRRAELLALGGMLMVVLISIVPSLVFSDPDVGTSNERRARRQQGVALAGWIRTPGTYVPSELYVSALRKSVDGQEKGAILPAAGIFAWALVLHGLTWPIYQRLLQTPATTGSRRRPGAQPARSRRLPLVGPTVSAVALVFTRLAFRTPRGRAIILMPVVMLIAFSAITVARQATIPFGPVNIGGGYSLGIFGLVIALMSIGPLVFNQFAVDRAGLTLEFLAPISTRALLYGKAIGGALIAAVPSVIAIAAGVATGGHSLLVWSMVLLGACASYLITAPIAAVLSLLFPRAVDLSSIGQGSNAHQAAGLLGFLAFAASCAPPAGLAILGLRFLDSTAGTVALLALWFGVAAAASWVGFRIAERLLDERRENLTFVAQGR
ncbi:MAG: hypothetical protein ACM36C_00115 [Acidobacteriota bacterium]